MKSLKGGFALDAYQIKLLLFSRNFFTTIVEIFELVFLKPKCSQCLWAEYSACDFRPGFDHNSSKVAVIVDGFSFDFFF